MSNKSNARYQTAGVSVKGPLAVPEKLLSLNATVEKRDEIKKAIEKQPSTSQPLSPMEIEEELSSIFSTAQSMISPRFSNLSSEKARAALTTLRQVLINFYPSPSFRVGDSVIVNLKSWEGFACEVVRLNGDHVDVAILHPRAGRKVYPTLIRNLRPYTLPVPKAEIKKK